jgi:hypothetical protein
MQKAEKIVSQFKGLRNQLQEGEQPILTIPAIWDSGRERHGTACDVVLTNQRLFGFYFVTFPRERLFLDALPLSRLSTISVRQKSFEPLFRELLVSDGERKVYIRASRQKIETLYQALRSATSTDTVPSKGQQAAIYTRQEIRQPFENSPLAITLLFVGGISLEILGILLWMGTRSSSVGIPLCFAGLLAVFFAFVVKRQQKR